MFLKNPWYLLLILILTAGASCASTYPYDWYTLDGVDYSKGTLFAIDVEDDLPFSACKPDEVSKAKCILMFIEEHERSRIERDNLIERIKELEANCN